MIQVGVARGVEDVANANAAVHRLAGNGEDLGDHRVWLLATIATGAELLGLGAQLRVVESANGWLERVSRLDDLVVSLDIALILGAHGDAHEPIDDGNALEKLTHV